MINYNGTLIHSENAILSAENRAFKYGDALFETLKLTNFSIHYVEDHYFRLMASMRMLRMEIPLHFTMDFFENEILKIAKEKNIQNARVRFTVFRQDGGLYTPTTHKINFLVQVEPLNFFIKEKYTVELFKDYYVFSGLLSTIKTTNKLINVLAGIFAQENNFDNCILLNEHKNVVEVMNGNIFLVFGNIIKTPSLSEGCVKGVIRKKIIELVSKSSEFKIEETTISPFDLLKADEVFLTNAIIEIQPVHHYKKAVFNTAVSTKIKNLLKTS